MGKLTIVVFFSTKKLFLVKRCKDTHSWWVVTTHTHTVWWVVTLTYRMR